MDDVVGAPCMLWSLPIILFDIAPILCLLCSILCYSTTNFATDNTQFNKHFDKVCLFMNFQLHQHTA